MLNYISLKIRLLPKKRKEPYLLFYELLGFMPHHVEYYQLALCHKSIIKTPEKYLHLSNERLEFLGDAIINSVVTDILYHRFQNRQEGFLTQTRSKIVMRESLNQLAINIGLDKLLKTSKYVNQHTNNNIYGNALEALIGAIYLDLGYRKCKQFIISRLIDRYINFESLAESEINYKSKLIEWCQKNHLEIEYILLEQVQTHNTRYSFESEVIIHKKPICKGIGASKKESQQNASLATIEYLENHPNFLKSILNPTNSDIN